MVNQRKIALFAAGRLFALLILAAVGLVLLVEVNAHKPKGSLDFVNERFDDVLVAMVDGKGCVRVRRKIRGSFRKPEVKKVVFLRTVAGPMLKLLEQANMLFGGQCEVFYAGSITPPE